MQQTNGSRRRIIVITLAIIVCLLLGELFIHKSPAAFRVVSVNPTTNNVATTSPYVKVTFSQSLSESGLSVTSNPSVISSSTVSDKTLTVNFNTVLSADTRYTITIKKVESTSGKSITNYSIAFRPSSRDWTTLSQQEQQTLLKAQDQPSSQPANNITFSGTDALVSNGVSSTQIYNMEQAFYQFKAKANTVNIIASTIVPAAPNPSNYNAPFVTTFSAQIDDTTYAATLTYSGLEQTQLTLSGNGQSFTSQVYNAGQ